MIQLIFMREIVHRLIYGPDYPAEDMAQWSRWFDRFSPTFGRVAIEQVAYIATRDHERLDLTDRAIRALGAFAGTSYVRLRNLDDPVAVDNLDYARQKLFELAFAVRDPGIRRRGVDELSRGLYIPDPTADGMHYRHIIQQLALLAQSNHSTNGKQVVRILSSYSNVPYCHEATHVSRIVYSDTQDKAFRIACELEDISS